MSVEFKLFLRKKPKLECDALGAMAFDLAKYVPSPGDPLERESWRDEIRWVIEASGRISDYDEWLAFVARTCKRYGGVLWSAATKQFEQLGDVDDDETDEELEREDAELADLVRMIERAAGSPETMRQLKTAKTIASNAFRVHFTNVLIHFAETGAPVEPWRWALRYVEPPRYNNLTPINGSRDQVAYAKKGTLAAAIVERFEEVKTRAAAREQRKTTAKDAKKRAELERWLEEPDVDTPMIEKRRRGGEKLAGLPRSTAGLVARGKIDEAISDYAKRYGLAPAVAREVVLTNAPQIPDLRDTANESS